MLIKEQVLFSDEPSKDFHPIDDDGKIVYFVEGTIGIGKSTLIEERFSETRFVRVLEPLREMEIVLEKFYSKSLDAGSTAHEISTICMNAFLEGHKQAMEENKDLVVERIPWMRKWIFSFSRDATLSNIANNKNNILSYIAGNITDNDIISNHTNVEKIKELREYDKIIFLYLHPKSGMDIIYNRMIERNRKYESSVSINYLQVIDKQIFIMHDPALLKAREKILEIISLLYQPY